MELKEKASLLKEKIEEVSGIWTKLLILSHFPNSGINREGLFEFLNYLADDMLALTYLLMAIKVGDEEACNMPAIDESIKNLDDVIAELKKLEKEAIERIKDLSGHYIPIYFFLQGGK